jgi:hypothetical protein
VTIAFAWIRTLRDCEELVFASDSRLSGDGRTFDGCPKILTMPRTDCVIAFAGYTGDAFPLMLQLGLAVDSHAPARRGSLDITVLKSHALKIFDEMATQIESSFPELLGPAATLLFGGYSWVKKQFELWTIQYKNATQRFEAQRAPWMVYSLGEKRVVIRRRPREGQHIPIGRIAIAGDQATEGERTLASLLEARRQFKSNSVPKGLDMEPFEAVRDMLRDPNRARTIGGAPQVVKVYQYMSSAPLAVYWPKRLHGRIVLQGRPTLGYERIDRFVIDPDTLRSERPTPREADIVAKEADNRV